MTTTLTPKLVLAYLQVRDMLASEVLPTGYAIPEIARAHEDNVDRLRNLLTEIEERLTAEGWKNEESEAELREIARLA